jgi:hypothetical protein
MKRNLIYAIALLPLMAINYSCSDEIFGISGSGQIISESRAVSDFDEIELSIAAEVEITRDTGFSLELSDYENLLSHIETRVEGNKLVIRHKPHNINLRNSEARLTITMPALSSISVNGSGKVTAASAFNDLESIWISGSGNISAMEPFETSGISIVISGSGNVSMAGTAEQLNTNISGSGNINCFELVAQDATCMISGSGNTYVNVANNLNATVSGSGNIIYMGNPALTVNISGSGTVKHK